MQKTPFKLGLPNPSPIYNWGPRKMGSKWSMHLNTLIGSISLKYHCVLSLYNVIDFTIKESPHPSNETFCRHQLPIT